jgi:hypothetical protein
LERSRAWWRRPDGPRASPARGCGSRARPRRPPGRGTAGFVRCVQTERVDLSPRGRCWPLLLRTRTSTVAALLLAGGAEDRDCGTRSSRAQVRRLSPRSDAPASVRPRASRGVRRRTSLRAELEHVWAPVGAIMRGPTAQSDLPRDAGLASG